MKEATGELSGTVIVIILLALVIGIGTWLFKDDENGDSQAKTWIKNIFENRIENYDE